MKEFALIFRLKDISDFKPSPEQMQERMNWLGSIAAQNKLVFHWGYDCSYDSVNRTWYWIGK